MKRIINFAQAINEALQTAMEKDPATICYGLGVPDPKGVFGTTLGLKDLFGTERVFDMPTSENAMTGVAIGAAIAGLRPIMCHQRADFVLMAMDQIVNNASKWHYMFNGKMKLPLTIRLITGRGWGQGPTHSQTFHSLFAHIPGLKVVTPTFPNDAKELLLSSIFDDNPVLFLEHRWLHGTTGDVPEKARMAPLGKAIRVKEGGDITLVGMSYMTIEALLAAEHVAKQGVACDVIDLRTISPLDWDTIFDSVRRTGRLLVLDIGWATCSIGSEIVATVTSKLWKTLKSAPQRVAMPNFPVPTGFSLTKDFYPQAENIVLAMEKIMEKNLDSKTMRKKQNVFHDVPGDWFKGPF